MKDEMRAHMKATIRENLSSSALNHFPRIAEALRIVPGLTKELVPFMLQAIDNAAERTTIFDEYQHLTRRSPRINPSLLDPKTGLDLLPSIQTLYSNRSDPDQSPEDFLKNSDWAPLACEKLIYSEYLRQVDPYLLRVLYDRARCIDICPSAFLFLSGIINKEYIGNPPKGYERQAQLMSAVSLMLRSQKMASRAKDFSPHRA